MECFRLIDLCGGVLCINIKLDNVIVVVDYNMGNLRSVEKNFVRIGANVKITSNPNQIAHSTKIILPGVGHFSNGVNKLKELNIWDALNEAVLVKKTPILGICLGMQLMAKHSEEGDVEGLCWLDADVVKFKTMDRLKYKVPHMGWNNIISAKKSPLLNNVNDDSLYYFVHSYHIKCNDTDDIICSTHYEKVFTSVVQKENIFGTQFHPEKSHDQGEKILKNFLNL
jgi:imidazole glycerol-phosphate synthase subunit HisH